MALCDWPAAPQRKERDALVKWRRISGSLNMQIYQWEPTREFSVVKPYRLVLRSVRGRILCFSRFNVRVYQWSAKVDQICQELNAKFAMKGYVIAIVSALFIPIVLGKLESYFRSACSGAILLTVGCHCWINGVWDLSLQPWFAWAAFALSVWEFHNGCRKNLSLVLCTGLI